jgi:hypothetical protein
MDDFFDEFHEDFDDCDGDDFEEDGLGGDETDSDGLRAESEDEAWNGPSWQDWIIIGPLAESLAREKRERERNERKMFRDKD